ncbi:hypothetical protein FGF1_20120 [Flavobacteriaceae bacterium GF1]
MENFDVDNSLNPKLVRGAIIYHEGSLYQVKDMDKEKIYISNQEVDSKAIADNEWNPVDLTEDWLNHFNFEVGSKIHNVNTKQDWIIKTTGNYYYITVFVSPPYGDNPVIGLKYVHDLQAWFFTLTKRDLGYFGFNQPK